MCQKCANSEAELVPTEGICIKVWIKELFWDNKLLLADFKSLFSNISDCKGGHPTIPPNLNKLFGTYWTNSTKNRKPSFDFLTRFFHHPSNKKGIWRSPWAREPSSRNRIKPQLVYTHIFLWDCLKGCPNICLFFCFRHLTKHLGCFVHTLGKMKDIYLI